MVSIHTPPLNLCTCKISEEKRREVNNEPISHHDGSGEFFFSFFHFSLFDLSATVVIYPSGEDSFFASTTRHSARKLSKPTSGRRPHFRALAPELQEGGLEGTLGAYECYQSELLNVISIAGMAFNVKID